MSSKIDPDGLHVDWCDYKAAKYACTHWHYSKSIPAAKLVKVGVWERGEFIGCVIFSRGATKSIGSPYGLDQTEICELTRIAMREHSAPVSQIVSMALRLLREQSPGVRLVVSYAAAEEGHHGGIYQAGNWVYVGPKETHTFIIHGKPMHAKTIHSRWGKGSQRIPWLRENVDPKADKVTGLVRHKYLMPLDKKMRRQIRGLAQPYPKP